MNCANTSYKSPRIFLAILFLLQFSRENESKQWKTCTFLYVGINKEESTSNLVELNLSLKWPTSLPLLFKSGFEVGEIMWDSHNTSRVIFHFVSQVPNNNKDTTRTITPESKL